MLGLDIDGAFADFISIPASLAYKIPDSMSFESAAYVEPVAAALAVLSAPILKKHRGLIVGYNRMSTLVQRILSMNGFDSICVASEQELPTLCSNGQDFDYLVETNLTTELLPKMLQLIKRGGALILKSRSYESFLISPRDLIRKEICLKAVNYGSVETAIELITAHPNMLDGLIGPCYQPEDFAEAFLLAESDESQKPYLNFGN
jgi:L-iditol 2-dehydrogenase